MTQVYPRSLTFIVLICHFFLFFFQQIKFNDTIVNIVKASIYAIYFVLFLTVLIYYRTKIGLKDLLWFIFIIIALVIKLIFIQSFNIVLLYWFLITYYIYYANFSYRELVKIVNIFAMFYFIFSILFSYTSLKAYYNFDIRELENRFLFNIDRFIGLEGSPAGPDLFYTIVFLLNIYNYRVNKVLFKIPIILSIIIIIWSASLSNLISVVLACLLYYMYRFRVIAFNLMSVVSIVVAIIYNYGSTIVQIFLNKVTTLRAHIWYQVYYGLLKENTLEEWFFGRESLVEFFNLGEKEIRDANPHSLYLFAFQFLGIFLFILFLLFISKQLKKMQRNFFYFLTIFILVYSITNGMPLTTRGNPIIIYVLIICFLLGQRKSISKKNINYD